MTVELDPELARWWPTTQSLDLVEGPSDAVAEAVWNEVTRYVEAQDAQAPVLERHACRDLDAAFALGAHEGFRNVPTRVLVLPTSSRWSVLWNDSFLCDGYDALCRNLTVRSGFTTIHWSAHDRRTTFQPGACFVHRQLEGDTERERSVHVTSNDSRWSFHEFGTPLPEEDPEGYAARRGRDRLDDARLVQLLGRLDARPWRTSWYAIPAQPVAVIARRGFASRILSREASAVLLPRT